jgi:DNA-binding CsgD family transcriptional regulator
MGFVGLHRGKSQGSFALEQTDALGPIIVDIRRMLAIRGRLSRAERRAQEASEVFDAIGDAFVTVSSAGRIVHLNASAEALLREADGLTVRHGRLCACAFSADRALLAAIAQAVASDGTASAVPIPRKSGGQFDLTVVPLSSAGQDRRALVTVRDVHACDPSVATRLRQLYRLSSSEAAIAVLLAEGFAPDEIAAQRGAAIGTVRVQVKTVAAKMECRGQREIAAAVNRLIRLYPDRLA